MRNTKELEEEVAKLVMRAYPEFASYKAREEPDVDLLRSDGSRIGLEVVRLVHDESRRTLLPMLSDVCRNTASQLKSERVVGRFFVYFAADEIAEEQGRKEWKRQLPPKLARVIAESASSLDRSALSARGIDRIEYVERRDADATIVIPGYYMGPSDTTTVARTLREKHKRLRDSYRLDSTLQEHWLAFVSFGPGSLEDGGLGSLLAHQCASEFDRLLLVEHDELGALVGVRDVTATRS